MKRLTAFLLLFVLLSPALRAADREESETDLDMMVRFLPLSDANSAGRYETALAECEKKLAGLPSGTQSLYVAYCYKNMVYALRGLNRKDELDRRIGALLRDFPENLPLLAVISMDDLPFIGFWQDHFFHRAEAGFQGKPCWSLERHDRARILRAMLTPPVPALAEKASPRTRALYLRNLIRHLARVSGPRELRRTTSLAGPLPEIEPFPSVPAEQDPSPDRAAYPENSDGARLTAAVAELRKLADDLPADETIRRAFQEALAFQEELFRRVPPENDVPAVRPFPGPPPLPALPPHPDETGKKNLPYPVVRAAERLLRERGRDAVSRANEAAAAVLTGQAVRTVDGAAVFSGPGCGGWYPADDGEEKDPAVAAFLLETANLLRKSGFRTGSTDPLAAFLERRIRLKSFQVKEGKQEWTDADALAACACAGAMKNPSLAPAQRIYPDRDRLSLFSLAMLARAFPETMPEYDELRRLVRETLKKPCDPDGIAAALLLLAERDAADPDAPSLLAALEECPADSLGVFALAAAREAVRKGIRPEKGKIRTEAKKMPDIRISLDGDLITLQTDAEQTLVRVRVRGPVTRKASCIRTRETGMLVHFDPEAPCAGEEGPAADYFLCRLPAGTTSFRLLSPKPETARILPVSVPR